MNSSKESQQNKGERIERKFTTQENIEPNSQEMGLHPNPLPAINSPSPVAATSPGTPKALVYKFSELVAFFFLLIYFVFYKP